MQNQKQFRKSAFYIQRKWQKVIQPLIKYERKNNGFDDPLGFYYELEKIIELGHKININIPQTMTGAHDNFLQTVFSSQNEQIGQVRQTATYSKTKFEAQAERSIGQSLKKIKNSKITQQLIKQQYDNINSNKTFCLPFVAMKQKIKNQKMFQKQTEIMIWNSYQYKKISSIDMNQISQVYIFSKNLTASIVRFFYFPNTTHSVAYKIQNEQELIGKKKNKSLWKVQEKTQFSCYFMKIMFQDKSFLQQTLNLIRQIQRKFNKQVIKIVTDWILDPSNRYYLIDVKEVKYVDPKPKFRIHKSLTQLLSTVTCSMCLQTCNQSQIGKVLTNKLINNFYYHLNKRGSSLSFRINFKKISNLSRVCDLCYSVVVAEAKLIEAERKMSIICNYKMQEQTNKYSYLQQENTITGLKMNQWRLFFYLQDIKDLFKILNQKINKQNLSMFFMCLEVDDSVTYFEFKSPFSNNFSIRALKIQYIFSQSSDIRAFIQKAEIKFKVLSKLNSTKPIAEGCFHGIFNYESEYSNQNVFQRKYKQVLLFNQNSNYAILGLYIGIANDGEKATFEMQTKSSLGISRPKNNYVNCESLPAEWMEIIDQNYREAIEINKFCSKKAIQVEDQRLRARIRSINIDQKPKNPDKLNMAKQKSRGGQNKLILDNYGNSRRKKLFL